MDESTTTVSRLSKRKRAMLTLMPLLLLLLCLGLLNSWARSVVEANPAPTPRPPTQTPSLSKTAVTTPAPALETVVTETPTPAPTQTATPLPQPTLPPTATITLLGPPNQSRFMAADTITLYWSWPLPLSEDQYFGIYLQEETGESRIGRLEEANFGTGYRWQTAAQSLTGNDGGEVNTLIKLETILTDTPLLSSEPRTLFILKNP
jgi:hypothetical protein